MKRRYDSLLLAALILGFPADGTPARAQDDADAEEVQPARPRPGVLFASDEQFERWFDQAVFGRAVDQVQARRVIVVVGGQADARERLNAQLAMKLRDLDRRYRLTDAQKKKLELAGKRDIQRYFDAAGELKQRLKNARDDRAQFLAILNERRREFLVKQAGGENVFGEGSLLTKTLRTTLASDPIDRAARDAYRSHVDRVISRLDERLGLTDQQHRRFVNLIAEETHPLRRYGGYDAYAVMFQASTLPEADLERVFNRTQMLLLHDLFGEARGCERFLIEKGYLARDRADRDPPGERDGAKGKPESVRIARPAPIRRGFTGRD
jgi:hypothetical protein